MVALHCDICKGKIDYMDHYGKDGKKMICWDCLAEYILDNYLLREIAESIGIDVQKNEKREEDEEKKPEPIPLIRGQMDIWGGALSEV